MVQSDGLTACAGRGTLEHESRQTICRKRPDASAPEEQERGYYHHV